MDRSLWSFLKPLAAKAESINLKLIHGMPGPLCNPDLNPPPMHKLMNRSEKTRECPVLSSTFLHTSALSVLLVLAGMLSWA
jgi:hypothetical protein